MHKHTKMIDSFQRIYITVLGILGLVVMLVSPISRSFSYEHRYAYMHAIHVPIGCILFASIVFMIAEIIIKGLWYLFFGKKYSETIDLK